MSVEKSTSEASQRRRVVVVDNDPVMRVGTQTILASTPHLDVLAAIGHDAAIGWTEEWSSVDVAVVDASDHRREGDQFPGVDVIRAIRASGAPVTTVVLTGQYLHPGLRRRMWEAGADFFYGRDEGMTEDELVSVVTAPDEHRRMRREDCSLPVELGVTSDTAVNELVDKLGRPELATALGSDRRKKTDPHGERSRWWIQLRRVAAGPRGLLPVKASGATAMDLESPSVVQLRKFWTAMARTDSRPPD